jgi:hypothetical protein
MSKQSSFKEAPYNEMKRQANDLRNRIFLDWRFQVSNN